MIAPRISMINGVSQVQVQGQQKYAVRVQVDPDKLAAKQIGLNEVDAALEPLERQSARWARCTARSRPTTSTPTAS